MREAMTGSSSMRRMRGLVEGDKLRACPTFAAASSGFFVTKRVTAADQLVARERLADPAIGVRRLEQTPHPILGQRGDEHDRQLLPRADQRAEAMTWDLRQLDVDQDEIGGRGGGEGLREIGHAACLDRRETFALCRVVRPAPGRRRCRRRSGW